MFSQFCKFISHVKFSFVQSKQSRDGPIIGIADDISRILSNCENSDEIKYTVLSDITISDICDDSGTSTVEILEFSTRPIVQLIVWQNSSISTKDRTDSKIATHQVWELNSGVHISKVVQLYEGRKYNPNIARIVSGPHDYLAVCKN